MTGTEVRPGPAEGAPSPLADLQDERLISQQSIGAVASQSWRRLKGGEAPVPVWLKPVVAHLGAGGRLGDVEVEEAAPSHAQQERPERQRHRRR